MQLWSIYSAGNTVPIPFLRATDISPIALLSDNMLGGSQLDDSGNIAVDAIQELFTGDAQSKKGRNRQNEVRRLPVLLLLPSLSQPLTFVWWVSAVAGTFTSQCIPETRFKSYSNESCSGPSLPQNVRVFCSDSLVL